METKIYHYKNMTGTLRQICYVYRKDYDMVKRLLDDGETLEFAMDILPKQKICLKNLQTQNNVCKNKLTDEAKYMVMKYRYIIKEIMNDKNCNDEDIESDLILYLCEVSQVYVENGYSYNKPIYLRTKILQRLLKLLRDKNDRNELKELYIIEKYDIINNNDLIKFILPEILKCDIDKAFVCLNEKEKNVLYMRFGLTESNYEETLQEIGNKLGCHKERVRQLEAKGLRKLRCCNLRKILLEYLYDN